MIKAINGDDHRVIRPRRHDLRRLLDDFARGAVEDEVDVGEGGTVRVKALAGYTPGTTAVE